MAEETETVENKEEIIENRAAPTVMPKYSYTPKEKKKKEKTDVSAIFKWISELKKDRAENGKGSSWRDGLDEEVRAEINELIKETHKNRNAYKQTLKVGDAQQWVALANISLRLKKIEKTLASIK